MFYDRLKVVNNNFFIYSSDGVPEDKSKSKGMKIISLAFKDCGTVMHWKIFQAKDKATKADCISLFTNAVREIKQNGLKLNLIVADAIERKFLRCMSAVTGTYGCEICTSRGETRQGSVFYPPYTMDTQLRTMQKFKKIATKLPNLSWDKSQGIIAPSPFLDLPYFDIIWNIPTEPMHLVDLGNLSFFYCLLSVYNNFTYCYCRNRQKSILFNVRLFPQPVQ